MFNRIRTKEVFGYDIDPDKRSRRSDQEFENTNGTLKKHLQVIDNCPTCGEERQIQYRASQKNKPCPKCFHNSPEMLQAKQNQNKTKSEDTKQKMRDNHWSKQGIESPFKGKEHSKQVKNIIRKKTIAQLSSYTEEQKQLIRIKDSCTKRGIPIEDFNGFSAPEGTRIRQSAEGKAWSYDILSKANFTCVKCNQRGGKLHAHHLNGFNLFPEQRFDLNNGTCLCETCHDKFHEVYGKGDNTKDQFDEWLKS